MSFKITDPRSGTKGVLYQWRHTVQNQERFCCIFVSTRGGEPLPAEVSQPFMGSVLHGAGRGRVLHMSCSPYGLWHGKVLKCKGPARCRAKLQHLGLKKSECFSEHPSLHSGYTWSREGGSAHGKEKGQCRHPQSDLKVQGREVEGGGKSSANISTCPIGFTAWYLAQRAQFVDNYCVCVQNFVERISHPKTSTPLKGWCWFGNKRLLAPFLLSLDKITSYKMISTPFRNKHNFYNKPIFLEGWLFKCEHVCVCFVTGPDVLFWIFHNVH